MNELTGDTNEEYDCSDMNLDGVEYQAICSGLHSISQDTM
jgi:hypothetical protein